MIRRAFANTLQPIYLFRMTELFSTLSSTSPLFPLKIPLIDFDANLFHKDLVVEKKRYLDEARSFNLIAYVIPGSTLEDSNQAIELSKDSKASNIDVSCLATCGVHPYHTESIPFTPATTKTLETLIDTEECLAVGETGLDYSDGFPKKTQQMEWFTFQVKMALERKKPLYCHVRDAHEDFVEVLNNNGIIDSSNHLLGSSIPVVVHCFTGSIEELKSYVRFGFFIGLTGYIFKLEEQELADILSIITLERLVIETDAPYMGFKGCRSSEKKKKTSKYPNVPFSLMQIAEKISSVSGWDLELVAQRTSLNSLKYFEKDIQYLDKIINNVS